MDGDPEWEGWEVLMHRPLWIHIEIHINREQQFGLLSKRGGYSNFETILGQSVSLQWDKAGGVGVRRGREECAGGTK